MKKVPYLDADAVAKRLGIGREMARKLIRACPSKLKVETGWKWVIPAIAVDSLRERPGRGRPAKAGRK